MTKSLASTASIEACAASFRARILAERKVAADRAAELRTRAQEAARNLVAGCGATRVWLFGSLAWGEAHVASDVDLLVEGLPSEAWGLACGLAEAKVGAPVDVVRVEDAPPELVARIREQGILLHGVR
jgi:predicted nucleotidyltransferase